MMAATANNSHTATTLSPRSPSAAAATGEVVHGHPPHSRWTPASAGGGSRTAVASPWTQIVRRGGGSSGSGGEPAVVLSSPPAPAPAPESASASGSAPAPVQAPAAAPVPIFSLAPVPAPALSLAPVPALSVTVQEQGSSSRSASVVASAQQQENPMAEAQSQQNENSSGGGNGNGNGGKKPVWNKQPPLMISGNESGSVMGAASWPPLSESTKASPKLSPSDSSKFPTDASISLTQATGAASSSSASPPSPHKPVTTDANQPSLATHHGRPTRQRSMKRDGGSGLPNGGFPHQTVPLASVGESSSHSTPVRPGPGGQDNSARDHGHNNVNRESGQRSSSDHQHQRNSFRRGNGGQHSRGDSSHQNHGGRRDQDRANHDWNHQRNFNGRDAAMQPPRGYTRGYMRSPPPGSAPFIPPPPMVRPYVGPMPIHELHSMFYVGGTSIPFVQIPPQMFMPPPDPQLHAKIVNQIDYYFSDDNLIKDTYLRRNMDDNGWVPVGLIATFKKVLQLTDNVQIILDAMRGSTIVEVQGDKLRRRDNWIKWVMSPYVQFPTVTGSLSPRLPHDMLAVRTQSITLDENAVNHSNSRGQVDATAETLPRSSGDLNRQPQNSEDGASSSGF